MTGLWLAAVTLLLLALLFVVPALLKAPALSAGAREAVARRVHGDQLAQIEKDFASGALDPHGREQAIDELRRQALEEAALPAARPRLAVRPWMAWGVAAGLSVALPAAALLVYLQVGNPAAVAEQALADTHRGDGSGTEEAVTRLALRLRKQPDDVEGWIVLARSYEYLQRFDDAVAAYRQAMALAPGQPQLLADYADALASARGGDLSGPVQEAIAAALAIDPGHGKALGLAGMAAFQQGRPALARQHWQHLLALLPPGSELAVRVAADLARLDAPAPLTQARAATPGRSVGGTVDIAPALRGQATPRDTVFVLARAAAGERMPVAVLRLQVRDLPARFVLDDSLAMAPGRPISRISQLTVEVRVSRGGQAAPQPGDLAGVLEGVALGQQDLALRAERVLR
jgi:cytochrome c-type biogenesis protein CcmH